MPVPIFLSGKWETSQNREKSELVNILEDAVIMTQNKPPADGINIDEPVVVDTQHWAAAKTSEEYTVDVALPAMKVYKYR